MIEEVNSEIQKNVSLAYELMFDVPKMKILKGTDQKEKDELFASDRWEVVHNDLAIEKVGGVPITFYAYWDGKRFRNKIASIEDSHLSDWGRGPSVDGMTIQTLFPCAPDGMKKHFQGMKRFILNSEEQMTGFVSFHTNIVNGRVYYRKITVGVKLDFVIAAAALLGVRPTKLFEALDEGDLLPEHEFVAGLRLYAYPYNVAINKKVVDLAGRVLPEVDGAYMLTAGGNGISSTWRKLYDDASTFPSYVCYRCDGYEYARSRYKKLKEEGFI